MSKNKVLFDNDSDSDPDLNITTNKEYAKTFNTLRQKEMLQKFKDKRLSDFDSDENSSSSSDDDDEAINPEFTKTFFKTLASLKSQDPKIYDKDVNFFKTTQAKNSNTAKKKGLTLESYERKLLLETNGKFEDSDEDNEHNVDRRPSSPTIAEEEQLLKEEFKKALSVDESESEDENWGKIFKKKDKTNEDLEKEETQYSKWLAGKQSELPDDQAKALNPLKEFWSNPKLSKDETFLRDYILNNGYVDDDDTDYNAVPEEALQLSEDEKEVEREEEFEHKYNFRFEEPDQEFIKRYPRTIEQSVRKTDDKRKVKRLETKERKEKEKEIKMQELKEIKAIKRQEIEDKIRKLKEVTGNDALPFEDVDFEDDFDPEEHDRKMQKMFNDEYYQVDEGDQKPDCPDIEELKIEDWDNYDPKTDGHNVAATEDDPYCEDDDFNMDADYDPERNKRDTQEELIESTKRRRRKRKSKFLEVLQREKPVFDPDDEKKYGEYIDEYYKMDYEDIIGDTPCRFKYVETVPNDFGLSVEEIIMAKNSELNRWASLKKSVQFRPDNVEKYDVAVYKKRSQNFELKKKIFPSIYGEPEENDSDKEETKNENNQKPEEPTKKKKKKNKKRKVNGIPDTPKSDSPKVAEKTSINKPVVKSEKPVVITKSKNPESMSSIPPEEKVKPKKNKKQKETNSKGKTDVEIRKKVETKTSETKGNSTSPLKKIVKDKQFLDKLFSSKPGGKNKKNFNKKPQMQKKKDDLSDERLRAFGLNPSKFRYKQKMMNNTGGGNNKQQKSKTPLNGVAKKSKKMFKAKK